MELHRRQFLMMTSALVAAGASPVLWDEVELPTTTVAGDLLLMVTPDTAETPPGWIMERAESGFRVSYRHADLSDLDRPWVDWPAKFYCIGTGYENGRGFPVVKWIV